MEDKDQPQAAPNPPPESGEGGEGTSSRAFTIGAVLLFLIVGGVLASFALTKGGDDAPKRKPGDPPPAAVWNEGQSYDVLITVLPEDKDNLACASTGEIAGRHCGYETESTEWTKPGEAGVNDDKHVLKPYATTGRERFLAAGLWSEPALESNLPTKRFSVKCKYKVEGKMKTPTVRWGKNGPWRPMDNDWYTGVVSGCAISGS